MKESLSIASFNVRSLNAVEKRKELASDLDKHGIEICCVQETKIKDNPDVDVDQYRFLNLEHGPHHGLGFYVHNTLSERIIHVILWP